MKFVRNLLKLYWIVNWIQNWINGCINDDILIVLATWIPSTVSNWNNCPFRLNFGYTAHKFRLIFTVKIFNIYSHNGHVFDLAHDSIKISQNRTKENSLSSMGIENPSINLNIIFLLGIQFYFSLWWFRWTCVYLLKPIDDFILWGIGNAMGAVTHMHSK